jgi:uncharacterized coiled-coil protein SlyX
MTNEHSIARLSNELKELNERVTKLEEDLKRKLEIKLEPQIEIDKLLKDQISEDRKHLQDFKDKFNKSVQEILDYNDSNTKSNTES